MSRILVVLGVASILGAACGGAVSAGASPSSASAVQAAARADLASTGRLRMGFPANPPFFGQQDQASGQWKGLAIGLGNALAARLGATLVPNRFADAGQTYQALLSGEVDVIFAPLSAKPAGTAGDIAIVRLEHTYLVKSTSNLSTAADVDRAGIKVGSVEGSPHTTFLATHLQHAGLVQFADQTAALAALTAGRIDAYAEARPALVGLANQIPGSRILDGAFFTPGFGLVTISSRVKGGVFLNSFQSSELADGEVQRLVDVIGKPGLLIGPGA